MTDNSRPGDEQDPAVPTPDPKSDPKPDDAAKHGSLPVSGTDRAVDHDRQPGVPPASSDDYEDIVDIEGAESFPASDPPSGW